MKLWLKVVAWLFTIFIIAALAVIYWCYIVITPLSTDKTISFKVEPGATASQVANQLAQEKIISSARAFKMLVRLSGKAKEIKAGFYQLSSNSSTIEILRKLVKGEVENTTVTFPEGITIKQMGEVLQKADLMKKSDFVLAAQNLSFNLAGETYRQAEGFLLPETYQLPLGITPQAAVRVMLKEFSRQILPEYEKAKGKLPYPLDLKGVVILASLVEREAKVPGERPIIAAVYYNRLKKGINLECDATIQYALGKVKPELSFADLKIDSPYNTYLHSGLPPGAIGNPGKAALLAVLFPKKNDYLYYVLNYEKNDGSHLFSRTYREHLNKINNFRR